MRQHDIGEYPSNPKRAALLREVAQTIIDSGYAEYQSRRSAPRAVRAAQVAEIASDPRLMSRARHTQTSLVEHVMRQYNVTRSNARRLIHLARILGSQRQG